LSAIREVRLWRLVKAGREASPQFLATLSQKALFGEFSFDVDIQIPINTYFGWLYLLIFDL
jgi:hypothetical protein